MKKMKKTGEKIDFVIQILKGFFPKGGFKFSEAKFASALKKTEEVYKGLKGLSKHEAGSAAQEIHERVPAVMHMLETKGMKLKNKDDLWHYLEALLRFTENLYVVEKLVAHGYGPDSTKRAFGTIEYNLALLKKLENPGNYSEKLGKLKNKMKTLKNKNPSFLLEKASEVIEMSALSMEEKKLKEKAVNACKLSARLSYLTSTVYRDLYVQQYDSMSARIEVPFIPHFSEMAFKKVCAHPHHEKTKLVLKGSKYVCPKCKVKVSKKLLEEIKKGYAKLKKTGNIGNMLEAEFEPCLKKLERKKLKKDEFEKEKKKIIDKFMRIHEDSWREAKKDVEKIKKQIKAEGFGVYTGEKKSGGKK